MIKKYKAKVNTSLYRDFDGCIGSKHELEDVDELGFRVNTIGYIYLIEESEIEDRLFEGMPVKAIFAGKSNPNKEIWFESLEEAINYKYFDVTELKGNRPLLDFSKVALVDGKPKVMIGEIEDE